MPSLIGRLMFRRGIDSSATRATGCPDDQFIVHSLHVFAAGLSCENVDDLDEMGRVMLIEVVGDESSPPLDLATAKREMQCSGKADSIIFNTSDSTIEKFLKIVIFRNNTHYYSIIFYEASQFISTSPSSSPAASA